MKKKYLSCHHLAKAWRLLLKLLLHFKGFGVEIAEFTLRNDGGLMEQSGNENKGVPMMRFFAIIIRSTCRQKMLIVASAQMIIAMMMI